MTGTAKDSPMYARVSEAHLENFKRKIETADNEHILQGLLQTIDAAVEREMIAASDRTLLHQAVDDRRKSMIA